MQIKVRVAILKRKSLWKKIDKHFQHSKTTKIACEHLLKWQNPTQIELNSYFGILKIKKINVLINLSFSLKREKFSSFIQTILQQIVSSFRLKTSNLRKAHLQTKSITTSAQQKQSNSNKMPGVATQSHPVQTGYDCSQFYGTDHNRPIRLNWSTTIPTTTFNNLSSSSSSSMGRDVLDNKTNEVSLPLYNNKPIYIMSDIFHREDERLKTFDTWPLEWLDKFQLAQTGMFYTGESDKVKCYFCEVEIGRWEHDDQPVQEHMHWSPNCPLLRRRTTNNVPISVESLDRLLPPISYDICGANDAIEERPNAYAEGTASTHMNTQTACSQLPSCSSSSNYFPEFPEYAIEAARVRSFAEWPRHMKQKPEQLAEAGFFYTGIGDRVKCFSCGGGLKDWDDSDEPWEQHALWLSKCRFLKLMKGQTYIDAVYEKSKAKPEPAVKNINNTELSNHEIAAAKQAEHAAAAAATATVCQQTFLNATAEESTEELLQQSATCERKSHATLPEEKLCKICYADEYNTAFLPCGHVVACAKCASSVTKCPLCRKPFTDVMRVYFS